jgi:hypothetical protein
LGPCCHISHFEFRNLPIFSASFCKNPFFSLPPLSVLTGD